MANIDLQGSAAAQRAKFDRLRRACETQRGDLGKPSRKAGEQFYDALVSLANDPRHVPFVCDALKDLRDSFPGLEVSALAGTLRRRLAVSGEANPQQALAIMLEPLKGNPDLPTELVQPALRELAELADVLTGTDGFDAVRQLVYYTQPDGPYPDTDLARKGLDRLPVVMADFKPAERIFYAESLVGNYGRSVTEAAWKILDAALGEKQATATAKIESPRAVVKRDTTLHR